MQRADEDERRAVDEAPYRSLEVYKKAYKLALEIHRLTLEFPRLEQFELASQLRRSSKSIVVNLVEGMGRQDHPAEVQRYVRIAIGSGDESQIWLEFARDLGYLNEAGQRALSERLNEVGRMLRGVLNRYRGIAQARGPKRGS
jgi:four helix bundle protein